MKSHALILIVDDEDMNLQLLEVMLLPTGYTVLKAGNGREAVDFARRSRPDVILMDIMMPVMNGIEATRILKSDEATRDIPIVMTTALRDVQDRIRALEAGADDYMSKPFDMTELRIRVQTLVKVKAYHDHLKHHKDLLEQQVQERTQELQRAYERIQNVSLETIHILSRTAEFKDEGTGKHIQRIGGYAAAIARKIGLKPVTIERLLYAAPMHDIGKIAIPDAILLKPGKLDPDEWEIMKTHAAIGSEMLSVGKAAIIRLAAVIARTHHERWDGTGYPDGLVGRRIPLAGRIVTIADVFDALVSDRPYKKAFSVEEATRIIREGRGTHFDPEITDAFIDILPEIEAIRNNL
uniref:Response regulator n=1 Tax=Desulfatirhabdium butyrativorans TaxID=340467 RepID=A0A7C4W1X4_9BACT